MTFLTVLTRTCRRPRALAINQASLAAQTDPDYEQVLLPDDVGRGVAWANARMRETGPLARGRYVLVLDDDDRLVDTGLISDLKAMTLEMPHDVIVTRMDHRELGILPPLTAWYTIPARGHIGVSAVIVRADMWRTHCGAFAERYDGDYDFIAAVLGSAVSARWHDRVVSAVGRISRGEMEAA